jgi:hypothetical protein
MAAAISRLDRAAHPAPGTGVPAPDVLPYTDRATDVLAEERQAVTTRCRPADWTFIFLLACAVMAGVLPLTARQLTADQVISKCAEAMGGMDKIAATKTIRMTTSYPGRPTPIVQEIQRPNLMRTEAGYALIFDGKRGCFSKQPPTPAGAKPRPACAPAAETKNFEVDIARAFPAFFDIKPEFAGTESVGGSLAYKLRVVLPLGAAITYFIDAKTFLPVKATGEVTMSGTAFKPEYLYGDYKVTGGLKLPHSFTYSFGTDLPIKASVTRIEINVPLAADRFVIPEGIK